MEPVKAIVMTCDKYRALTDHMIFKYAELWPSHPFLFRVPYQELAPTTTTDKVEYKKTLVDIKPTVLTLLDDLDDDELIYWCIDDKYPIKLDVPRIEMIYQWLTKAEASAISGILFCRCRKMKYSRFLTDQVVVDDWKNVYLERKGYEQIWIHQFLRVKVLRYLFESFPDDISLAKSLDRLKSQVKKPRSQRIFVSRENLAVFGESTSRGIVTRNCCRSILDSGLALPAWCSKVPKRGIVLGKWDDNVWRSVLYLMKRLARRSRRAARRASGGR